MKRLLSFLLVGAAAFVPSSSVCATRTLYEKQSRYHLIRVTESDNIRTLTFRRRGYDRDQSRVDMSDPLRPCLSYYPLMFAGYLFVPQPQRILIAGLGAGVVSRLSAHYFPEAEVDSIELDPDVVDVAKRYFGFREGERQRVFVRDARVQIKVFQEEGVKYDIIMLDAFSGGYVPYHLTTKEFCEECRDILSPNGALVVNLRLDYLTYDYQRRTVASVFPEQYAFGGDTGSQVAVALPSERHFTRDQLMEAARFLQDERKFSFALADVASQLEIGSGFKTKGPIFTDAHVPVNLLNRQLDGSYLDYSPPMSPFARVCTWLKKHRPPVVSLSVVLIVGVGVLGLARRRRKSAPPSAS